MYFEGTTTIAAMCYQTLSHTNTYDKTYTQWICLLPAVDVVGKRKIIQFTVTCVMITIVQKIVILKSTLDHGRSFSDRPIQLSNVFSTLLIKFSFCLIYPMENEREFLSDNYQK